jgi:hypothetical protein
MVKIAIKLDFLNSRAEFSPNCKVSLKSGADPDKPILILELAPAQNENFSSYSLSKGEVEIEEPYDEDDKFWKGLIDLSQAVPAAQKATSPISNPTPARAPAPTPAPTPTPTPARVPTPTPTPAPAPTPTPAPTALSADGQRLLTQFNSLKNLITQLDQQFAAGKVSQNDFLQKKNFLGSKLGELMGQLDAMKIPYQF